MKISQENMSPRIPWYTVTAGPQKLKHARDLIQKWLFCGKDMSENLGKGQRYTRGPADWNTYREQRESDGSRESLWGLCMQRTEPWNTYREQLKLVLHVCKAHLTTAVLDGGR